MSLVDTKQAPAAGAKTKPVVFVDGGSGTTGGGAATTGTGA